MNRVKNNNIQLNFLQMEAKLISRGPVFKQKNIAVILEAEEAVETVGTPGRGY